MPANKPHKRTTENRKLVITIEADTILDIKDIYNWIQQLGITGAKLEYRDK